MIVDVVTEVRVTKVKSAKSGKVTKIDFCQFRMEPVIVYHYLLVP